MSLHSPAPLAFEFRRYFSGPSCPRCGNSLVAAEASEFLSEGHIRHFWACESCGQEFQTAVEVVPDSERPETPCPA